MKGTAMNKLLIKLERSAALEIERWIDEESFGERMTGSEERYKAMEAMRRAIRAAKLDAAQNAVEA